MVTLSPCDDPAEAKRCCGVCLPLALRDHTALMDT
jgi:hypothetical protein